VKSNPSLLIIGILLFACGTLHWIFIILAFPVIGLYMLQRFVVKIYKKTGGRPSCPNTACLSRAYTVHPLGSKFLFSLTGFIKVSMYLHKCRECGFQWIVYYKDSYDAEE